MFRATISASEATDVDTAIADLRAKCNHAGVAPILTDLLITQTRQTLSQLVERGQQLASMGSQMQVTRELSGDGYHITLAFQVGDRRRTFLQRILGAVLRG